MKEPQNLIEQLTQWAWLIRKDADTILLQTKNHRDLLQISQTRFDRGVNLYDLYVVKSGRLALYSRGMEETDLVQELRDVFDVVQFTGNPLAEDNPPVEEGTSVEEARVAEKGQPILVVRDHPPVEEGTSVEEVRDLTDALS